MNVSSGCFATEPLNGQKTDGIPAEPISLCCLKEKKKQGNWRLHSHPIRLQPCLVHRFKGQNARASSAALANNDAPWKRCASGITAITRGLQPQRSARGYPTGPFGAMAAPTAKMQ